MSSLSTCLSGQFVNVNAAQSFGPEFASNVGVLKSGQIVIWNNATGSSHFTPSYCAPALKNEVYLQNTQIPSNIQGNVKNASIISYATGVGSCIGGTYVNFDVIWALLNDGTLSIFPTGTLGTGFLDPNIYTNCQMSAENIPTGIQGNIVSIDTDSYASSLQNAYGMRAGAIALLKNSGVVLWGDSICYETIESARVAINNYTWLESYRPIKYPMYPDYLVSPSTSILRSGVKQIHSSRGLFKIIFNDNSTLVYPPYQIYITGIAVNTSTSPPTYLTSAGAVGAIFNSQNNPSVVEIDWREKRKQYGTLDGGPVILKKLNTTTLLFEDGIISKEVPEGGRPIRDGAFSFYPEHCMDLFCFEMTHEPDGGLGLPRQQLMLPRQAFLYALTGGGIQGNVKDIAYTSLGFPPYYATFLLLKNGRITGWAAGKEFIDQPDDTSCVSDQDCFYRQRINSTTNQWFNSIYNDSINLNISGIFEGAQYSLLAILTDGSLTGWANPIIFDNDFYGQTTKSLQWPKCNQNIIFPDIPIKSCGDTFNPGASTTSNLPTTYTSDNLSVAIPVSGNTRILMISTGIAVINGFQVGDSVYSAAPLASKTVTGLKGNQNIIFSNIIKKYGDALFPLTGATNSNLPLTYYLSGTTGVVNILNNISLAIQSTGQSFVVAVQSGDSCYNSATGIASLTVNKGDQTIVFNAIPIKYTNSPPFLLNVFSTAGLPVTISGNYVPIANIVNFLVTLSGVTGEANILAIQTGNQFYNSGLSVSRFLSVRDFQDDISFNQPCICDIIDISAGAYHNTALSSNYTITGWGNNDYLQRDFPNRVRYAYNISAGDGHSQAIVRTGINTGIINDYVRIPDGYGLFESENQLGKSTIVAGTFNFPWISTGIYNEILGFKDLTLTGTCLHPINSGGKLNPQYFDSGSLIDNTKIEELIAQAAFSKPVINIISVNNIPSGLSFNGQLGPINPDLIIYTPQPSSTRIPLFGTTGLYGPLYKEYQKIFYTEKINNANGIFATGRNDNNQSNIFRLSGIKSAIAGKNCSFVIYNNNTITGWGESLYGESLSNIHFIFTNVKDISNQGNHTLVLLGTNRVSGFGLNIYNQANGGDLITGISGIAAGLNHSLAILYNGKVTGWGDNSLGQTSGTTGFYNSWSETPVGIIDNATKISAGAYHNFICLENNKITGYGDNSFEKITKGLFLTGVIEVSAGENHTIALLNNGRVTGWGSNQYGQVSGTLNISVNWESTPVGILSGVKSINTSYNHNLALLENGRVTGWGLNDYKQHFKINTFPSLTGVTKISAGKSHSIFCLPDPIFSVFQTTNNPLNITGNITGFGITGSGLGITGYTITNSIFINKPTGINSLYVPTNYSIVGTPKLPGNYNTYMLIHELGAETEYAERYLNFSILETGRFPVIFKVCGGTIGLIDQVLN